MPAQDLTDEDSAAINRITGGGAGPIDKAIYRAGLAVGRARALEQCAQMCEVRIPKDAHWTESDELELCAAAIRALNDQ